MGTQQKKELNQSELKGKIALVTGGGRGLGEAICHSLADFGVNVVIADVNPNLAKEVSSRVRESGGKSTPVELNVRDEKQARAVVEQVLAEEGPIDILINNAGVDVTVPIEELSYTDWDRIIETNLRGPFVLSKELLPSMKQMKSGHIINVVSTASKRAWPNASAYHASKWGLLGFSHALHTEARPYQVKVTALICGGMRTPFLLDRFPDIDLDNLQDPKDVAETLRFLLSAPKGTVIPEIMAIPMNETSWP